MYTELKVGDRVMLKVEPRFKLTYSFKGPPIVQSHTPNNAVIQLQWDDSAQPIDVFLCGPEIGGSSPLNGPCRKIIEKEAIMLEETETQ